MEISKKLYLLRTEHNLTQADIAKIAGASDKAVSAWEKGIRSPKIQYIKPICERFGIDVNTFIDENNDIYKPSTASAPPNENKPAEPELDELDKEFIRLVAQLTPEQRRRQIEVLQDIVGRKDT